MDAVAGDPAVETLLHLQRSAGNRAVTGVIRGGGIIARDAEAGAAPPDVQKKAELPPWVLATPLDPIPGERVPGYEQPQQTYTDDDRTRMLQALNRRMGDNATNVATFVGEYGSAVTEIWGTYLTEAMAQAAEESSWDIVAKLAKFAVKEGVAALLVAATGGASEVAEQAFEFTAEAVADWTSEKLTMFGLDYTAEKVEEHFGGERVQEKRKELDEKTLSLAAEVEQQLEGVIIGHLGMIAPYGAFIEDPRSDPAKFRIPPLFPVVRKAAVRAVVAGTIVGLLHGAFMPSARRWDDENVINFNVEPGPGREVGVWGPPVIKTADRLANALQGQSLSLMPSVPLNIRLEAPAGADDEAVGLVGLESPFADDFAIFSPELREAFLKAYPSKPPTTITRDPSGKVEVFGGGLAEHLYLWRRATQGADLIELFRQADQEAESEQIAGESADAETSPLAPPFGSERRPLEVLAPIIASFVRPSLGVGAEALIKETLATAPIG